MSDGVVIDLPGAFDLWLEGTSLAAGQIDDDDADAQAVYEAYQAAKVINRGRGYVLRLTFTEEDAEGALLVLLWQTSYCLGANSDEPRQSEVRAANVVIDRLHTIARAHGWKLKMP